MIGLDAVPVGVVAHRAKARHVAAKRPPARFAEGLVASARRREGARGGHDLVALEVSHRARAERFGASHLGLGHRRALVDPLVPELAEVLRPQVVMERVAVVKELVARRPFEPVERAHRDDRERHGDTPLTVV